MNSYFNPCHKTSRNWSKPIKWCAFFRHPEHSSASQFRMSRNNLLHRIHLGVDSTTNSHQLTVHSTFYAWQCLCLCMDKLVIYIFAWCTIVECEIQLFLDRIQVYTWYFRYFYHILLSWHKPCYCVQYQILLGWTFCLKNMCGCKLM